MSEQDKTPTNYRGTRAHVPDLDWSQVRETVLMLEVSAGQISSTLRDSNQSVDVLASTFTGMAGYVSTLGDIVRQLPSSPETDAQKASLLAVADQVQTMVHQAVVAFQFYDRLAQRLSHVVTGLGAVGDIVGDRGKLYNPAEWVALQDSIRAKFTTPEERVLFQAVLDGMPVQEAIDTYLGNLKQGGDEVELF